MGDTHAHTPLERCSSDIYGRFTRFLRYGCLTRETRHRPRGETVRPNKNPRDVCPRGSMLPS